MIAAVTREEPTAHWLGLLRQAGLTVVAMRTLEDLLDDPHLPRPGFFQDATEPGAETMTLCGRPATGATGAMFTRRTPPHLGEHTQDVANPGNDHGW